MLKVWWMSYENHPHPLRLGSPLGFCAGHVAGCFMRQTIKFNIQGDYALSTGATLKMDAVRDFFELPNSADCFDLVLNSGRQRESYRVDIGDEYFDLFNSEGERSVSMVIVEGSPCAEGVSNRFGDGFYLTLRA